MRVLSEAYKFLIFVSSHYVLTPSPCTLHLGKHFVYGRVAKTLRVVLLARSPQPPSLVYAFARTRRDTHAPGASRPIRNNCCLPCLSVLIILALRHARNKFACVAANQLLFPPSLFAHWIFCFAAAASSKFAARVVCLQAAH